MEIPREIKIYIVICLLVACINSSPVPNGTPVVDSEADAKGILDNFASSTTAAPGLGGLGNLGGLGQSLGGAGPMMVVGSFQAILTKFDPSMIPSLPTGGIPMGK